MLGPFPTPLAEAQSPWVPEWRRRALGRMEDSQVQAAVASHGATTPAELEVFSRSKDPAVRMEVAGHSRTPVPVLLVLSRDENAEVREVVMAHPFLPFPALEELAVDGSLRGRLAIVVHPDATATALEELAVDVNEDVEYYALRHPNFPFRTALDEDESVAQAYDEDVMGADEGPVVVDLAEAWIQVVAPYGQAVEEVAWSVACSGFDGTLYSG